MTKVKVDLELLRKYFAEHYDFETNPGQYFRQLEYNLEESRQKQYSAVYEDISKLCSENAMQNHTETFFNLFFISWAIKLRQNHVVLSKSGQYDFKDQFPYKKELFSAFLTVLNHKSKSLSLKIVPIDSETIKIKDSRLMDKFNSFILDSVAELYFQKKWEELSSGIECEIDPMTGNRVLKENERTQVVNDVYNWLEQFVYYRKGAPDKTYFIKRFVQNIDRFIRAETSDLLSARQRHCFIGHLGVIYEIFPKPSLSQLVQGDNHFVQIAENYVLKKS